MTEPRYERVCQHCGYSHRYSSDQDDTDECPGCSAEANPISRAITPKLHVDGTLVAAEHAIELREAMARLSGERDALQAERDSLHDELGKQELTIADLRTKLAEHETLFAYATHRDEFLEKILVGLDGLLPPGTPRTVDGIVGAVADMALKLDAHEDASTPAFDEIAAMCGCPEWDYPGQVVRDVQHVVKQRDELMTRHNDKILAIDASLVFLSQKLRVAEVVRDDARAASNRYLDEKRQAQETAEACREDQRALAKRRDELLATIARLSQTLPFPDEWKDWESTRAKLVAEVGTLRSRVATLEEVSREDHLTTIRRNGVMLDKIKALTEQKDGAYAERDRCVAAIASLAFLRLGWDAWLGKHEPDPKWDQDWMNIVFIELPTGQVSWHIHDSEVPWFSFLPGPLTRAWDGHTTPDKYERLAGLSKIPTERAVANVLVVDIPEGQCPWILDDEDPDEGYWHCKHQANHIGVHETEFGKGRDQRWKMRGYLLPGDTSKAQKPPAGFVSGYNRGFDDGYSDRPFSDDVTRDVPAAACGCSLKYRELAPGVHAKYCQLAGQPL